MIRKRMNRLAIRVATMVVDNFREGPDCLAHLICKDPGALILHGVYSVPKLFGISAAGLKLQASLCFPN
jgi:hypothetical protein